DGTAQRDGVEPAAAALAAGDGAELVSDAREMLAVLVEQLGGEWSRAHARGVGLHDSEHVVEGTRTDARAGGGEATGGVRRGDEGIGAVVDVEHGALGAFEHDV